MELMTAGKFRHLPVVEEGQLVGIVSIGDVVKYRVQEIEFESATLRRLIRSRVGRAHFVRRQPWGYRCARVRRLRN